MIYIGIDPGQEGAIALYLPRTSMPEHLHEENPYGAMTTIRLNQTEADVWDQFGHHLDVYKNLPKFAYLEQVSAMPKQGVSSTFKFGQNYGFCRGLLYGAKIPFEYVTPAKWQGALGCRSGGDKKVTRDKAQRMFPTFYPIHATADAMLIAEYCYRTHEDRHDISLTQKKGTKKKTAKKKVVAKKVVKKKVKKKPIKAKSLLRK